MRTYSFLIIFLLFIKILPAQDLTGLWKGALYNDSTQLYYQYEIAISEEKGKLYGYSHTWFILDNRQYYGVKKVKISRRDGKVIVEDNGLIANNYPVSPAKNVRQLNILTLEIKDSVMTLSGPFTTNRTKDFSPLTGSINISRKNDYWQSALVPHLQELNRVSDLSFVKDSIRRDAIVAIKPASAKPEVSAKVFERENAGVSTTDSMQLSMARKSNPDTDAQTGNVNKPESKEVESLAIEPDLKLKGKPAALQQRTTGKESGSSSIASKPKAVVAEKMPVYNLPAAMDVNYRKTVLMETVYFKSDSLQISLYDNGEVDGDTVSVLMNGEIVLEKQRLSTNAVTKTIYIDPSLDQIQLVMYAENLGSIPPNTGLMVVKDGKEFYEIRFSGDFQQNAAIELKRKKQ